MERIEFIQLKDFFNIGNKIVLIGAAGLGKSTTLNYLFCNYEKMYNSYCLKIKIDLKEYAKEIGENQKDLLWCIATEFRKKIKRTKITFSDTENILGDFLECGKCLIILDALDEIPVQAVREKVRNEIARFCEIYYLNRFIISTREVGYLRNRFDDSFLHIKINDFEEEQIKRYSENWFCSYYQRKEFKNFWDKFYNEVKRARCEKLIRNPIVLILALVIFDIEKNLPNRRVEFYKKCIETFLTVREDRKGVFKLSEKAKNILGIDSVIPKIAYFKYSHITKNMSYKFSYDQLKEAVFYAIEIEDRINWVDAVNQYSEYLVDRTELIREIDEDVLDFAHKTFYEYFLAVYFTKEYENKELIDLLQEWIGDSNNDELARLIIEVIIQKDDPKQHKGVIKSLFNILQLENETTKWDNRTDIFMIIADLYSHNMLQPKFHSDYYNTILYYPRYVENVNNLYRRKYIGAEESCVKYDSKVLAEMFCKETQDDGKLGKVIESLYYLDREFNENVIDQLNDKFITYVSELFSVVRNKYVRFGKRKGEKEKRELLLNYFMDEARERMLNYSQVYVALVLLTIFEDIKIDISYFYDYQFEANTTFYYFSTPKFLQNLVYKASGDKENLLLLLILVIHCSKGGTNILIGYLLDVPHRFRKKKADEDKKNVEFIYWLWQILNQEIDFTKFKNLLLDRNLYLEGKDDIYKKLFFDYVERERHFNDHRIQEFHEWITSNNGNILATENQ